MVVVAWDLWDILVPRVHWGIRKVNVRIAHLKIAHWGAILRWAILSVSVIRIAHPNYKVFYELFVLDMGPG